MCGITADGNSVTILGFDRPVGVENRKAVRAIHIETRSTVIPRTLICRVRKQPFPSCSRHRNRRSRAARMAASGAMIACRKTGGANQGEEQRRHDRPTHARTVRSASDRSLRHGHEHVPAATLAGRPRLVPRRTGELPVRCCPGHGVDRGSVTTDITPAHGHASHTIQTMTGEWSDAADSVTLLLAGCLTAAGTSHPGLSSYRDDGIQRHAWSSAIADSLSDLHAADGKTTAPGTCVTHAARSLTGARSRRTGRLGSGMRGRCRWTGSRKTIVKPSRASPADITKMVLTGATQPSRLQRVRAQPASANDFSDYRAARYRCHESERRLEVPSERQRCS